MERMKFGTTFYLSRVIGNKLYTSEQQPIGKLLDLVVDMNTIRPRVVALKIKANKEVRFIDYTNVTISKQREQYHIQCDTLRDVNIENLNTLFLVKHVLDKQIVDMDGRKVVRVNDLRLVVLSDGTYVVAVDVGFEGFLRRLGMAKPLKEFLRPLKINIPSHLLLWDEVETIDFRNRGIKLSKTYTKLSTLHPSDLADILEDLDSSTQFAIFTSLDEEKAADVLEELEQDVQVRVLERISVEKAADMLEKMPADEVADILEKLEEKRANEILSEMEKEASEEVRELMDYPERSVGSLMTTDFLSFPEHMTVQDVILELRRLKPESDSVYYLYVVDREGKLVAHVSLRDLVVAEPDQTLMEIMNRDVEYVYDDDDIDETVEKISKYNLLALPVVDRAKVLIGMVLINDVYHDVVKSKRRK
jgi:magnesium transporter